MKTEDGMTVYRGFSVSDLKLVKEVWDKIKADKKLSGNSVFRSYIDSLDFQSIKDTSNSIIISATFTPVRSSRVQYMGKNYTIEIPHQYYKATFTSESVAEDIAREERIENDFIPVYDIPLKLIASMCGLTEYGKNNIAYTRDFGSYITINAYQSGSTRFSSVLQPYSQMEICNNCSICESICPGSAIKDSQFLKVEDCLTLYNEIEGSFPEHITRMPHHALMGCLLCQNKCPQNMKISAEIKGETLTEEETLSLYRQKSTINGINGLEKLLGITDKEVLKEHFPVYARNFHFALKGQMEVQK